MIISPGQNTLFQPRHPPKISISFEISKLDSDSDFDTIAAQKFYHHIKHYYHRAAVAIWWDAAIWLRDELGWYVSSFVPTKIIEISM